MRIFFIIFLSAIIFTGCDDTLTTEQVDNTVIPSSNVSFARHLTPVLSIKCATSGCHDDSRLADGLSFTSYTNITQRFDIIFPGKPENSKLIWAIRGQSGALAMPPIGSLGGPLTENQKQGFEVWIKEGAKNN
ncbi:MAG: hypothetical protein HUU54_15585 [Ignavibacteriaceae bacterium]|nr:hypothetical protein [Ignavibacteriaceae bacterium]